MLFCLSVFFQFQSKVHDFHGAVLVNIDTFADLLS
jgi:hypothetical protein